MGFSSKARGVRFPDAPRRGLPRPKFPSQVLTSYTFKLLPRLPSEAAESLSTSASSIGPWMGKFSTSNVLKKTRLNKTRRSSGPILYYWFLGDRPPVRRRWHWTNSLQREHSLYLLQCCKDMAGSQLWCHAHTPASQHRNNNVNISSLYQYILVHTGTY
jgi:hypothetical protein